MDNCKRNEKTRLESNVGLASRALQEIRHEASLELSGSGITNAAPLTNSAGLQSKTFEQLVIEFKNQSGMANENENVIVAAYVASSQLLDRRIAILIRNTTSSGKSRIVDVIVDAFPNNIVIEVTRISKTGFDYYKDGVDLKCFVIKERRGIEGCQYAIDEMISSGQLTSIVTHTVEGKKVSERTVQRAETSFISTTTGLSLSPESENRLLVISPDDSEDHRRVVTQNILCGDISQNGERLKQLRNEIARRLSKLNPAAVIPGEFMKKLLPAFSLKSSRVFRDADKFRRLLEIICLHRTANLKEHVITLQDYFTLRVVAGEIFTYSAQKLQSNYEAVLEMARRNYDYEAFNRQDLFETIDLKEDVFNKWVRIAKKEGEFLVVEKKSGNKAEMLRLNPARNETFLPSVDVLLDDGQRVELFHPITHECVVFQKVECEPDSLS